MELILIKADSTLFKPGFWIIYSKCLKVVPLYHWAFAKNVCIPISMYIINFRWTSTLFTRDTIFILHRVVPMTASNTIGIGPNLFERCRMTRCDTKIMFLSKYPLHKGRKALQNLFCQAYIYIYSLHNGAPRLKIKRGTPSPRKCFCWVRFLKLVRNWQSPT
jgi:hypothetical protein